MDSGGEFLGLSNDLWVGALLGAALSAFFALVFEFGRGAWRWWQRTHPVRVLLEDMAAPMERVLVFYRDLWQPKGVLYRTVEPLVSRDEQLVPNIDKVWPHAEAAALANVLYVLAVVDKSSNVSIEAMSADKGTWDASILVLGAQTERCFQFYEQMEHVAYAMSREGTSIIDCTTRLHVPQEPDHRYGIILKARNPHRTEGGVGVAFLLGGFGVLGTESVGYYFRHHYRELARDFGSRAFGIVVRAPANSGPETAVRLREYDRAMEPKTRFRRAFELLPFVHRQV